MCRRRQSGDKYLRWVLGLARCHALGAALGALDRHAGVIASKRAGPDEYGVAVGSHLVDTIEVGLVGER